MFLAGCSHRKGFGSIYGSEDGRRWELLYRDEGKERAYTFYAFARAGGTTVAVGGGDSPSKTGPMRVLASRDGKGWEGPLFRFELSGPLLCVARRKDRFVAGGMHGLRMTSKDGLRWENKVEGEVGEHLNEVVWTGTEFVAVGVEVTYKSADGVRWTRHPTEVRPARAGYGNGVFLCANL